MDIVENAERFARERHAGQFRKGKAKEPYVTHLEEVYSLVKQWGGSDIEQAAAWLQTFLSLRRDFQTSFSTHKVKDISLALSASWVMDQIPIAARHVGHLRTPNFQQEGYLPAATNRRPA